MSVAGAACARSASASGRTTTVARARKPLLVVADLDDAEPLENCADATQYVNAVRIRTAHSLSTSGRIRHPCTNDVEPHRRHVGAGRADRDGIPAQRLVRFGHVVHCERPVSTSIGGGRTGWFRTRPASRLASYATFVTVIATVLRMRNETDSVSVRTTTETNEPVPT